MKRTLGTAAPQIFLRLALLLCLMELLNKAEIIIEKLTLHLNDNIIACSPQKTSYFFFPIVIVLFIAGWALINVMFFNFNRSTDKARLNTFSLTDRKKALQLLALMLIPALLLVSVLFTLSYNKKAVIYDDFSVSEYSVFGKESYRAEKDAARILHIIPTADNITREPQCYVVFSPVFDEFVPTFTSEQFRDYDVLKSYTDAMSSVAEPMEEVLPVLVKGLNTENEIYLYETYFGIVPE